MSGSSDRKSLVARAARRASAALLQTRVRLGTRIAGGSGFDYWATLSDRLGEKGEDAAAAPKFVDRAAMQFDYLMSEGLKPSHRFLDYGCAILRTAQFIVPYLEPGNYVGADVNRTAMRLGVERLSASGIPRNRYHLVNVRSARLSELQGFSFDRVFANSVVQYLSDAELVDLLTSFRRVLSAEGTVFVSFPDDSEKDALRRKGQFFREPEHMLELARDAGLTGSWHPPARGRFPWARHVVLRAAGETGGVA